MPCNKTHPKDKATQKSPIHAHYPTTYARILLKMLAEA